MKKDPRGKINRDKINLQKTNTNSKVPMHPNVHSSIIYNSQVLEQPKCPSVNEGIKKLWYIYTMEFYTAEGKKDFLPFVTA